MEKAFLAGALGQGGQHGACTNPEGTGVTGMKARRHEEAAARGTREAEV